ncbi:hemicentin-1-like [Bufo bufo]|uniref:hemicentin-1-like n=1 Tax=Bufo bufo TaxID=8384 RepID=UPI001ABE6C7C|nr:hemicentin-1-like [Bufo bufo]
MLYRRKQEGRLSQQDLCMNGAEAEWTLHGRPATIMSCTVPVLSLLICAALLLRASTDSSRISSRLPHQILMNTSVQVIHPPVRMDILSVRWDHNGRPLVEYKDGSLTFHSSQAVMSLEQIAQGNISLVLTNLTLSDAGNYTCAVQYGGAAQIAIYGLILEPTRIRLLNLTPPPRKAGVASVRSTTESLLRHVEARRGENVTLPCDFKTDGAIELSMLIVHWSKDGVTKYFSNKTCCDYPGHDISEGDLQNGRAPLQLINVQDKDTGVYTCAIKYEDIEETWNTIVHVQDALDPHGTETMTVPAPSRDDDSVVPEPMQQQHRTLKFGLVSGVVAVTGLLAVVLYFCFEP